jgi:triphosphoribosyl-dephospho-CoA synthase
MTTSNRTISNLSVGQLAALACLWEASASKPGNVHRAADFEDLTFVDFAVTAVAIVPAFDSSARGARLGSVVLDAVSATRQAVATNVNLGSVLLMAPLALAAQRPQNLREAVAEVLASLDAEDARLVYEAIRLASPGGMGRVEEADVAGEPPADLLGRQYANGFSQVFDVVVPEIAGGLADGWPLGQTIVHAQLKLMSEFPDSLIARKCGDAVARQSALLAAAVLAAGEPHQQTYQQTAADLDFWLRSDGHRRNPGTTADLLAAGLFAALLSATIQLPVKFY